MALSQAVVGVVAAEEAEVVDRGDRDRREARAVGHVSAAEVVDGQAATVDDLELFARTVGVEAHLATGADLTVSQDTCATRTTLDPGATVAPAGETRIW